MEAEIDVEVEGKRACRFELGCRDARISAEKRKDFRIVALHTERPILFSRFEMWVAGRLYVGTVVSFSHPSIPHGSLLYDGTRLIFCIFAET